MALLSGNEYAPEVMVSSIPKTVLIIQSSPIQGLLWHEALASQGIRVVWETSNIDLDEYFQKLQSTDQPLPSLLILDLDTQGVDTPYGLCHWCTEHYPQVKVILIRSDPSPILPFEHDWAKAQGAVDLLPGFQPDQLMPQAHTNVNTVLMILDQSPVQESALSEVLALTVASLPQTISLVPLEEESELPVLAKQPLASRPKSFLFHLFVQHVLRKGWPTGHLSAQASIQNFQKLGALLRGYLWPWIGLIGIGGLLLSVGGYWQHLQKRQTLNAVEPMTSANQLRRFSLGDKILITADSSIDKQEGVKLFQQGRFLEAVSRFEAALNQSRNDPESRIYLNNARAAAKANPVKIAVSAPIGGNVNVAKEILRGAAQYQYEINGGKGIQGRGLQILVADDENDPDVAEQIAVSLSEDKSVLAVIGHQSSDTSIAAAPIYQKAGVVMISPTSYARQLSSIGNFIFRTTPNSYAIASRLARYTVNTLHYQKVAICIDTQSQASASYRDDFIAAFYEQGGQITRTMCDFSSADFNPNTIASQAIRDGASGLLLVPPVERLGRAIDVIQANKGKIPLLGGPSMYTFEILQKGLVNANGMTLAVAWAPSEAKGSSYSAIAQKLWGGSGSWRTAMAYDAVKSVVTGLQRAQNRKQLQETLSNPEFTIPGATGIIQFMPTGDRNKAGTLVKILPGKNSGVGYDFVTVKP